MTITRKSTAATRRRIARQTAWDRAVKARFTVAPRTRCLEGCGGSGIADFSSVEHDIDTTSPSDVALCSCVQGL